MSIGNFLEDLLPYGALAFIVVYFATVAAVSIMVVRKVFRKKLRSFSASQVLLLLFFGLVTLAGSKLPNLADKALNRLSLKLNPFPALDEAAIALHKSLFVVDMHADTLMWPHRDILVRNSHGHVDLPRLQEGNVALQAFTIVTGYALPFYFL